MAECKNCGKQIPGWCEYCNDQCYDAYQYKQAQAELNDAQAWIYDAEMRNQHIYSCMDNLEEKYRQAQATIAAMRGALKKAYKKGLVVGAYDYDLIIAIQEVLIKDTAGAELLAERDRLQRENKALRCCGNCEYDDDQGCKLSQPYPFNLECKDFKNWQIAERLVRK